MAVLLRIKVGTVRVLAGATCATDTTVGISYHTPGTIIVVELTPSLLEGGGLLRAGCGGMGVGRGRSEIELKVWKVLGIQAMSAWLGQVVERSYRSPESGFLSLPWVAPVPMLWVGLRDIACHGVGVRL